MNVSFYQNGYSTHDEVLKFPAKAFGSERRVESEKKINEDKSEMLLILAQSAHPVVNWHKYIHFVLKSRGRMMWERGPGSSSVNGKAHKIRHFLSSFNSIFFSFRFDFVQSPQNTQEFSVFSVSLPSSSRATSRNSENTHFRHFAIASHQKCIQKVS